MKQIEKFLLTCGFSALAFWMVNSANAQTGSTNISKYMPSDTAALKTLCLAKGECDAKLSCRITFLDDSLNVRTRTDSVIDAVAKKYNVPRSEITKLLYRDNWVKPGIKNPTNAMETDLTAVNRIQDVSDDARDADANIVFLTAAGKLYDEQIKNEKNRLSDNLDKSAQRGDFDYEMLQRLLAKLNLLSDGWKQDAFAATKENGGY